MKSERRLFILHILEEQIRCSEVEQLRRLIKVLARLCIRICLPLMEVHGYDGCWSWFNSIDGLILLIISFGLEFIIEL